ncbi:hypothetical protein TrRE_jg4243 [Triparma retinervis]|uniref:TLC domain-containing protein n=1 Tax=Triparma retinervis TaxID=2557542 RepID=A0A9W7DS97_9STRA|nr:hypothetical protein TrRE_jg4243 [Triparma retinervis]
MVALQTILTPILDGAIVSSFAGAIYALLSSRDKTGGMIDPISNIVLGCSVTGCLQVLGKLLLPRLFGKLSLNKADLTPVELSRNRGKFEEMVMSLVLMSISSAFMYSIFESTDWAWWKDQNLMYTGPSEPPSTTVNYFYSVTVGTWITSGFCCRFIEEKNRDWLLMYTHHALTIALICGSYVISMERVGCIILFLHQVSDIVLNICQLCHYLGWDADHFPLHIPVAEALFAVNILSWIYTRLYILPTVCTVSVFTVMHDNEYCGDYSQGRYFCDLLGSFLCALQVMHVWWLYEMLSVAYKILSGVGADAAARSYLDEKKEKDQPKEKSQ